MAGLISKATYLRRLDLSGSKWSRSPHLSVRIITVYIEVLAGFSHIFSAEGLNNTLFSHVLERAPSGHDGRKVHSKEGGGAEEPLTVWV